MAWESRLLYGRTLYLYVYYYHYFSSVLVDGAAVLRKEDIILSNVDEGETHLTPEDFHQAQSLFEVDLSRAGIDTSNADPLLRANKFEGDIAGLSSTNIHQYVNDSNSFGRNAIRDTWRRWPNGQIPYVISTRYGSYSKQVIAKAMDEYHRKTCIRFVPRDENLHRDYIYIFPDDGCYSLVGRTGGRQPVSLDSGCIQTGTVQHELMHATGFFHEQSRSDRDDYIDIVWDNVLTDATDQFEQYTLRTITLLDMPYDYASIMHYGPYAFTKNGQRTIKAKKAGFERMGQRDGFSDSDLLKLNKLYECGGNGGAIGQQLTTIIPTTTFATTTLPSLALAVAATGCDNKKWQCFFWYRLNYCSTYADYMKEYCPKSCNLCVGGGVGLTPSKDEQLAGGSKAARDPPPPPELIEPPCADFDPRCDEWMNQGLCKTGDHTVSVQRTCPRACGMCDSAL